MKKDPIEELLLQTSCIKAYFELLIPCLKSLVISLEKIIGDLERLKKEVHDEKNMGMDKENFWRGIQGASEQQGPGEGGG